MSELTHTDARAEQDDVTRLRPSARLQERLETGLRDVEENWTVPAAFINDAETHEVEQERVFGRAWVLLAHESEIPEPGDYVLRHIGRDEFIVCRDEDGEVRAMLNSCRHRGMAICRAEAGNTSHFRCSYHGWTYKNTGRLAGVPAGREAYGDKLDRTALSLKAIPRLGNYKGLIFGSIDPEAEPLPDYLGDMRFYLDIIIDRSDSGLEVMGGPQRWIMDANWKLGADNFVGDAYHLMWTHRSGQQLRLLPPNANFAMFGEHVSTRNGHGLGLINAPAEAGLPGFQGVPENIVAELRQRLTPEQVRISEKVSFIHGTVFPNFSFLNVLGSPDHKSPPTIPLLTFRIWHPLSAGKMEVISFCLVEKDAPQWFKDATYKVYVRTFGVSGIFEQDDAENWRSITRVLGGELAKSQDLNYQMGRDVLKPDENWPGPGTAYPVDYAEANQRNFLETWMRMMNTPLPARRASDAPSRPGPAAKAEA